MLVSCKGVLFTTNISENVVYLSFGARQYSD